MPADNGKEPVPAKSKAGAHVKRSERVFFVHHRTVFKRRVKGMLTEQRYELILKLLEEKKSITVSEVKDLIHTSESTVRRDITALHQAGKLVKVFGGAIAADHTLITDEPTVAQKVEVHKDEKQRIAEYAASLVTSEDFVYLDAGTTTGCMLDYLAGSEAVFVTNAVAHAQSLAAAGLRVFLVGGELKASTEAVVGNQAMLTLKNYHFTKGFFGANGISRKAGFTTPDANEALIKKTAMEQCQERYVLGDVSKFGKVSAVTFTDFQDAQILTESRAEGYSDCDNIIIVP